MAEEVETEMHGELSPLHSLRFEDVETGMHRELSPMPKVLLMSPVPRDVELSGDTPDTVDIVCSDSLELDVVQGTGSRVQPSSRRSIDPLVSFGGTGRILQGHVVSVHTLGTST